MREESGNSNHITDDRNENENRTMSPYQLQQDSNAAGTNSSSATNEISRSSFEHEAASTTVSAMDISISEMLYSASSYNAMVFPVSVTMILAALAVVFINTEETLIQGEREMTQFYTVFKSDDTTRANQSIGTNLAQSIGNSFIIVTFIGAVTFLIVILYKYRFLKCLIGYMIFSSASLLGALGSTLFNVAIEKYRIPIDIFTFYFFIFNFAVTGVIAIFYQNGIPMYITQTYLVATSVILAWQLAHFDPWTTWTLLVFLALYDLCAVLSPCGPLKALVGLMQQDDAPDMPGLLYEARLPEGVRRSQGTSSTQSQNYDSSNNSPRNSNENSVTIDSTSYDSTTRDTTQTSTSIQETYSTPSVHSDTSNAGTSNDIISPERIITIPLAIAKVYKLPLVSASLQSLSTLITRHTINASTPSNSSINVSTSPLLQDNETSTTVTTTIPNNIQHTAAELKELVQAVMPISGGKIVVAGTSSKPEYLVYNREGELRRTLVVDQKGKVMQVLRDNNDDDDENGRYSNSIRLGLGDFIFYSVLVSKAAMYSFTTFVACMICILTGMGATLILLSVYKAALPALPISIFLAVIFYLLTVICIEPFIEAILSVPFYV